MVPGPAHEGARFANARRDVGGDRVNIYPRGLARDGGASRIARTAYCKSQSLRIGARDAGRIFTVGA